MELGLNPKFVHFRILTLESRKIFGTERDGLYYANNVLNPLPFNMKDATSIDELLLLHH
jgi:hypothetical protein